MGVHDGHRERMRERFEHFGGSGFTDHELIEMLLYYAYPRRDTNEKAHEMLNEFGGSVTRLINSDISSIVNMCGVSRNTAVLIGLIGELNRRVAVEKWNKNVVLDKAHISGEYALSYLNNLSVEKLYIACLNNSMSVIKCVEAASGSVEAVYLDVRKIIEIVINAKASNIILMHNHPSGNPRPSYADINFTQTCYNALSIINVDLKDHIIVGGGNYFSFKEHDMLPKKGEDKYEQ